MQEEACGRRQRQRQRGADGGNAAACVDGAYKDPAGRYCVKFPDAVSISGDRRQQALGGNAYWVKLHLETSKQTRTSYAIRVGDKYIMDCTILSNDASPPEPADACKTLESML